MISSLLEQGYVVSLDVELQGSTGRKESGASCIVAVGVNGRRVLLTVFLMVVKKLVVLKKTWV